MIYALLTEVACEFWPFAADPGRPYSTCGSCVPCAMFLHDAGAAQRCRLAPGPVPVARWPSSTSPGPSDTRGFDKGLGAPWGLNHCVCRLRALVQRCRGALWCAQPWHRCSISCPSYQWHQRDKLVFECLTCVFAVMDQCWHPLLRQMLCKQLRALMLYMDFLWISSYAGNWRWTDHLFFPTAIKDALHIWQKIVYMLPQAMVTEADWDCFMAALENKLLFFPNYFIRRGIRFLVAL